jgi:hypothetical protein
MKIDIICTSENCHWFYSTLIPMTGTALAIMKNCAPAPTLYKIYRGDMKKFNSLPFLMMHLFSLAFCLYGLRIQDYWLLASNTFGLILGILFILVCLPHETSAIKKRNTITIALAYLYLFLSAITSLYLVKETGDDWLGFNSSAFLIVFFISPLCGKSDASHFPWFVVITGILCNSSWLLYGIYKKFFFVAFCHVVGLISHIAQILLLLVTPSSKSDEPQLSRKRLEMYENKNEI